MFVLWVNYCALLVANYYAVYRCLFLFHGLLLYCALAKAGPDMGVIIAGPIWAYFTPQISIVCPQMPYFVYTNTTD